MQSEKQNGEKVEKVEKVEKWGRWAVPRGLKWGL